MKKWWCNLPYGWRMAIKQFASAFSAVIIANVVDPETAVLTWAWTKHILVAMFFLTLINEARYIGNWASTDEPEEPDA